MRGTVVLFVVSGSLLLGQASVQPLNSAPNPYTTIGAWGTLPPGRAWGGTSGVLVDRDGRSLWVAERRVTAFIPDATPDALPITAAEGVAVDGAGNVYGAVVPARMIQKHLKK
jgi:hypothetical protein